MQNNYAAHTLKALFSDQDASKLTLEGLEGVTKVEHVTVPNPGKVLATYMSGQGYVEDGALTKSGYDYLLDLKTHYGPVLAFDLSQLKPSTKKAAVKSPTRAQS